MSTIKTESAAAWDMDAVAEFAESDDVLMLGRSFSHELDSVVQAARVHEYLTPVSWETAAREVRFGLGEFRIRSNELAEDLTSLVTSFLTQFELNEARLRIEVTRTQACPKFHCDNIHVRLVTTYVGPTTEYQYVGEDAVHVAPLYGLVFLKGHQFFNHKDSVHHRSPKVSPGKNRLCVAIDY